MTLDQRLAIGRTFELGSHTFGAEEITAFARKFDPQPFHLSEEKAKGSVFGRLCASGWHTAATWMRHNVDHFDEVQAHAVANGGPVEFGPAAGLRELKWLRPVYVGETISFRRTPESHRALTTRRGWRMLTSFCEAAKQTGEPVMQFKALTLVRPL